MDELNVLQGLRVLEVAEGVAGPKCGKVLRDLGSAIIRIKPPDGDWLNRIAPFNGENPIYTQLNDGKEKRKLDLTASAEQKALLELARTSDIITVGERQAKLCKLGLAYETLKDANSGLIYCHVTVAIVLTTAERARDLKQVPAYVAAASQQTANRNIPIHYTLTDHIQSGKPFADRLWADAGRGPKEMSAVQLYDGFAPSTWYWLESAGFCGRGEAHAFTQDGRIALDGALPVNTFGGALSQGRLHGMGHLAEAIMQVSDRAGSRQIPGAEANLLRPFRLDARHGHTLAADRCLTSGSVYPDFDRTLNHSGERIQPNEPLHIGMEPAAPTTSASPRSSASIA